MTLTPVSYFEESPFQPFLEFVPQEYGNGVHAQQKD
jgi:hypothetical protein